MHGNTETTKDGIKTRRFENILQELEQSYRILKDCGTHLGGVHFELTGDNVTECIGGASGVTEADLARDYRSATRPATELRAGDGNGAAAGPADGAKPEVEPAQLAKRQRAARVEAGDSVRAGWSVHQHLEAACNHLRPLLLAAGLLRRWLKFSAGPDKCGASSGPTPSCGRAARS